MYVSVDTVCGFGFCTLGWYFAFPVLHDMSTTGSHSALLSISITQEYVSMVLVSLSHVSRTHACICILGGGVGHDEVFLLGSWIEEVGVSWLHR